MKNNDRNELLIRVATRALAIVGFVAIIGAGIWGSLSLARGVPGAFNSLAAAVVSLTSIFVPAVSEAITLSVPSLTVKTGTPFVLSWEHLGNRDEGTYTFRYSCENGVSFTSPTQSGSETTVFCTVPFNFLNADNSITLTALSDENRSTNALLFIDFIPEGASEVAVSGSMTLTIINEDISVDPETPVTGGGTPTTPVERKPGTQTTEVFTLPGGGSVSDPNGRVDLTARVIEIGVVSKSTGVFTASSTPNRSISTNRVAIRFAVENIGTKNSGQFTFNAVLPTFPSHIFSSPTQQNLGPGDRIEFTLGFDSFVDEDEGVFVINIDPASRINELNKDNNIVRYTIKTIK